MGGYVRVFPRNFIESGKNPKNRKKWCRGAFLEYFSDFLEITEKSEKSEKFSISMKSLGRGQGKYTYYFGNLRQR